MAKKGKLGEGMRGRPTVPSRPPNEWYEELLAAYRDWEAAEREHREAGSSRKAVWRDKRVTGHHTRRAKAGWGLIDQGSAAIPYALRLLRAPSADMREDGAGVLSWLGGDDCVVDEVVQQLRSEHVEETKTALIGALGACKNRRAIPVLAEILRDESADAETRFDAALALGSIVRRRFDRQPDAIGAALEWLDAHSVD